MHWTKLIGNGMQHDFPLRHNTSSRRAKLADADAEELRQVVYGPGSPTTLSPNDLDALLPKEATDAIAKRREEVARWSSSPSRPAANAGAERRRHRTKSRTYFSAAIRATRAKPCRGSFPSWLPATIGSRFTRGAAGWKWPA